jgi:hypothetical protein
MELYGEPGAVASGARPGDDGAVRARLLQRDRTGKLHDHRTGAIGLDANYA